MPRGRHTAGGGRFLYIIIMDTEFFLPHSPRFIEDVRTHCPFIRSLDVHEDGTGFIPVLGRSIQRLECYTLSPSIIADNCPNIHDLTICKALGKEAAWVYLFG